MVKPFLKGRILSLDGGNPLPLAQVDSSWNKHLLTAWQYKIKGNFLYVEHFILRDSKSGQCPVIYFWALLKISHCVQKQ